jgi:hypothetical protein
MRYRSAWVVEVTPVIVLLTQMQKKEKCGKEGDTMLPLLQNILRNIQDIYYCHANPFVLSV